jgi:hypothetical protein
MYYAYQSSTPLHIIEKCHLLAMNPIKGPKMRCNVPQFLEIYDAQPKVVCNRPSEELSKEFYLCRKLPRYVPYKGTYVLYDGTYGAPDQGQTLDV